MASADVGIASGVCIRVAIASAGIVLVSDYARAVLLVIDLYGVSYRKVLQNLGWAAGFNMLAIPLAAGRWPGPASSSRERSAQS